jgi:hypothetical protein
MTVESILCGKLGIRFVDARNLSVQARLNLGLSGYASKRQEGNVLREALKIFEEAVPDKEKDFMRTVRKELDIVIGRESASCDKKEEDETESELSTSFRSDLTTPSEASLNKRTKRKVIKLWTARKA